MPSQSAQIAQIPIPMLKFAPLPILFGRDRQTAPLHVLLSLTVSDKR